MMSTYICTQTPTKGHGKVAGEIGTGPALEEVTQLLMKEKSENTGGSLGATQLFLHPQQGRNGFGVYDFSCHGHAYSLVEREKPHSNALILFRLGQALLQPARQIH